MDLPEAERVMQLARTSQTYPLFSYPEVRDVRDNNTVFSSVAAYIMLGFAASQVRRALLVDPAQLLREE